MQRGDACVWPGREGLFRSKGHRCSADADGRCLSALPAPQACWASPPRTCSTASSPSSSPSSTSGSETTPRCGAVQGGVGWVVMLGGSGLGEMHGVTPGSAAARSWAAPLRTSTSTHSRLHSPHSCPLPAAAHRPPPTAHRPPPTAHRLLPRRAWRWHLSSSTTVVPCSESTRGLGRLCCGRTTACTRAWQVRGWHAVRGTVWPHGL